MYLASKHAVPQKAVGHKWQMTVMRESDMNCQADGVTTI